MPQPWVVTEITGVISGVSSKENSFFDRKSHGLIYKDGGESLYQFNGKKAILSQDELLFIPRHSDYTVKSLSPGRYILVDFLTQQEEGLSPKKYNLHGRFDSKSAFGELVKSYPLSTPSQSLRCMSLLYNILSALLSLEEAEYLSGQEQARISPALDYLNLHLFDCGLKVQTLCDISGVSGTYFRKIFLKRFGVSPISYIAARRIQYAKSLFDSGEFSSVAQVAFSAGYNDPLYFGKVFKRKTGFSPADYLTQSRKK